VKAAAVAAAVAAAWRWDSFVLSVFQGYHQLHAWVLGSKNQDFIVGKESKTDKMHLYGQGYTLANELSVCSNSFKLRKALRI